MISLLVDYVECMEKGSGVRVYCTINHFGQLAIEETIAISGLANIQMIQWNSANATNAWVCEAN